jgi:hypothetical protein
MPPTIISGDTGIDKVQDGSIGTADLAAGAVTQAKLGASVAGNGPAFSAYLTGANQSVTGGTWTKVNLNAETFDTASAFDSTTNYRFQPTVAGYYLINGAVSVGGTAITAIGSGIYKNGAYENGAYAVVPSSASGQGISVSHLTYLNGTTDYAELFGIVNATTPIFSASVGTRMSGFLARAA